MALEPPSSGDLDPYPAALTTGAPTPSIRKGPFTRIAFGSASWAREPVRHLTWSQLGDVIGSGARCNGVVKIASPDGAATLAGYVGEAPVDVTWPSRDLQVEWRLDVGDMLLRHDVHERYGGIRQGGIGPSRTSQNVLIFTDRAKGKRFGYNYDGWHADGTFRYTGEGQFGDQKFRSRNKAIRDHKQDGRALRVLRAPGLRPPISVNFAQPNLRTSSLTPQSPGATCGPSSYSGSNKPTVSPANPSPSNVRQNPLWSTCRLKQVSLTRMRRRQAVSQRSVGERRAAWSTDTRRG